MKIKRIQFADVAVGANMKPRVAFYAYDDTGKRYVLIKSWGIVDDVTVSDDYTLVMKSVSEETADKIDDYMNDVANSVIEALENTLERDSDKALKGFF